MRKELDNFVIEYDKELTYMSDIIRTLEDKTGIILEFFGLDKLSKKKLVKIFTDREKFKEYILNFVPEFKEWMCGHTYDGNINLLSIEEAQKSEEHKDMTLEEFIECIVHEFVHSCQQELSKDGEAVGWYWEALATNLSGQYFDPVDLSQCDFNLIRKNFNNTQNAYQHAYALGKYMLANYSKEQLLEYIKNPSSLRSDAESIYNSAVEEQLKNRSL